MARRGSLFAGSIRAFLGMSIEARPSRLPFGFGRAETVVHWAVGNGPGELRVLVGEEELLVARGEEGATVVSWIQPGQQVTFRLYDNAGGLVGAAAVQRDRPATASDLVAALRHEGLYREAAEREDQVWGELLGDPGRNARVAEAQEAGRSLRVGRDFLNLAELLVAQRASAEHVLSLGCGSGRLERSLVARGLTRRVDGIDISAEAIASARESSRALKASTWSPI